MKIPLQVYDSISRGRLAVSRYNGSGRFTLRIATLVLTSAVFGLLVSHLFVSSRSFNQNNSDVAEEYSELSLETNDDVQNTTIDQSSGNGLETDEDAETNYGTPWYRNVFQKLLFSGPLYNPEGQSEQSTLGDSIELGAPDKASESTMRPRITHGERPYVGKVTINVGNPDDDLCERAIKTHVAHNKIHNYQAFVLRHSQGSEFNRLWSKPAYLLSIVLRELAKPVGERLEWLFWADADTIIINPNIPAESFLPPVGFERIHLLLTEDASGLSDGVFFIRINTWSVEFLSSILAFPQYRPDTPLPLREQSAMMQLVGERNFKSHVMMMPQRWFNAYPGDMNHTVQDFHAKGGDLLVHFDDYSEQSETMEAWLKRAEAHDQSWEMEPQSTSYQSEIEAFWEDFKRKGKEKTKLLKDVHQDAHGVIDDIKTYATEYRNRFGPSLLDVVKAEIKQLRKTLEDDVYREDANRINDATGTLRQIAKPVLDFARMTRKTLFKEAHNLLLQNEDERDYDHVPNGARGEDLRVENALGALRKLLINKDANPKLLEKTINEVTVAKEALKSRLDFLKLPTDEQKRKAAQEDFDKQMKQKQEASEERLKLSGKEHEPWEEIEWEERKERLLEMEEQPPPPNGANP